MERFLSKPISILFLLLTSLAGCSDNEDCGNRPIYNYTLEPADYAQLAVATPSSYRFMHAVSDVITDTIELFSTGVDTKRTSLENTRTYSEHSDNCYVENYDNIDTRKYLFVGDRDKKNSLGISLMAARVRYSNYYWSNSYSLDPRKNLDISWTNASFSCFLDELQGTGMRYRQSYTYHGKTFNDVYLFYDGTSEIYMNKNIIAHIRVNNETWTKL